MASPAKDPDRLVEDLSRWLRLAATSAEAATSPDDAVRSALDLVCEITGWPLGHALWVDGTEGRLVPSAAWHEDQPGRFRTFVAATAESSLDPGTCLPGRVVADGEALWVPDVRAEPLFLRAGAAAACGIAGGFLLPVVSGRGVEGVLEFFTTEPVESDGRLLDLLSLVGVHVGGVLDRIRAVRSLEASEATLRNLVESAPDALIVVDGTGAIVLVNDQTEQLSGYGRDDLVGRPVDLLVPDARRAEHVDHRSGFLAAPRRRSMGAGRDLLLRRVDGAEVPVDIGLSPIDVGGSALVVASVRDLTERRLADEAVRSSEARLAEAQHLARMGSWTWEVGTDTVTWSAELHRLYGLEPGHGPHAVAEYLERVHPDDRAMVGAAVQRAVAERSSFEHQYRVVTAAGVERWVHAHGRVVVEDDGAVRVSGYCRDITEEHSAEDHRRRAVEDLASHRQVLERIARNDPLGATLDLLCRDVEHRFPDAWVSVLLVDPGGEVLRHAAAPSLDPDFCRALDGLPVDPTAGACGKAAATGEVVVVSDVLGDPLTASFDALARRFDLRSVWSQPLRSATGHVLGTFAVYRSQRHVPDADETTVVTAAGHLAALAVERDLAEKALARAAQRDPLTGLPNRARFLEQVDARLAEPGAQIAVMFLDLDRFKWINDSLGHTAGDRILTEVAERFERVLGPRNVLARFGGDEFTVLIDAASPSHIARTADAIRTAFAEPFLLDGGEFFLTVSIGIACNDADIDSYGLVRDADTAMYAAKESGRDRHVLFDERLRERAVARVTLESEMRRGIERDELVMHYQPIVELASGTWAGAEALVRWHHPSRGLVLPDTFVPLAEETGLIVPLGARVLEQTIAQAAAWADAGLKLVVAANLSAIQLSDPMIARYLALMLRHHGLPADRLVLEVTESAVMERLETAHAALGEIAGLGVQLVIDDFGTGYSSIARLRELPVTGIKIDRSFTEHLGDEPGADDLVGAIADLAHALGLHVAAEGIASPTALVRVRELGCDFAQGFHLARPLPGPGVAQLVHEPPPS